MSESDRSPFCVEEELLIEKDVTQKMRRKVLKELEAIGFARVTDFMTVEGGELVIRDSGDIPKAYGAAVASMEKSTGGVKLKFYDKLKALELMGKLLGLFDGAGAEAAEDNNLIDAILSATGEEVSLHGLPEIQPAAADCHELVEPTGAEGL